MLLLLRIACKCYLVFASDELVNINKNTSSQGNPNSRGELILDLRVKLRIIIHISTDNWGSQCAYRTAGILVLPAAVPVSLAMGHLLQLHKLGPDDQKASFSQRNGTPVSTPTLPKMPPHQAWKILHTAHLARSVVHICFLFVASTSPQLEASSECPAVPSYGQRQGGAGWSLKTEQEVSCLPWLRDRALFLCSLLMFTSPEDCETDSILFYTNSVLMLYHWLLFHQGKGTVSPVPCNRKGQSGFASCCLCSRFWWIPVSGTEPQCKPSPAEHQRPTWSHEI